MNTFGTRCSSCLTSFKVNTDLLRLQDGHGACGQCGQVFDMQAALFLLPPHTINFIEHPAETDSQYPELSAVITVLENAPQNDVHRPTSKLQARRTHVMTQVIPTGLVPKPINDVFYRIVQQIELKELAQKEAENITFHAPENPKPVTEIQTNTNSQVNTQAFDTQPVIFKSQPIFPKSANKTWLTVACWVLLAGACLQIAGLFSREISKNIPVTRALYEKLNLPTDRG